MTTEHSKLKKFLVFRETHSQAATQAQKREEFFRAQQRENEEEILNLLSDDMESLIEEINKLHDLRETGCREIVLDWSIVDWNPEAVEIKFFPAWIPDHTKLRFPPYAGTNAKNLFKRERIRKNLTRIFKRKAIREKIMLLNSKHGIKFSFDPIPRNYPR